MKTKNIDMFAVPVAPAAPSAPLKASKAPAPQPTENAPPARSQRPWVTAPPARTPVYYITSGISTYVWLCPKHVVARKKAGWTVKGTGTYADWGCDDCPREPG
jgi:hypothetical protein